MLVIRLLRVGKKNQPAFKIVVTDKKNPPRGGRFIEEVGNYSPLTKQTVLKKERVKHWLSQGAQPSATVHNLLVKQGVLEGKKIPVHKKPKKKKEEKTDEKPIDKKTEAKPQSPETPKEEVKGVESPSPQPAEKSSEVSPQPNKTEESPKEEPKIEKGL